MCLMMHYNTLSHPHPHTHTHTPTHTHTRTHTHTELNEFVIQLDEELDAMMAVILSLQQQLKGSRDTAAAMATVPSVATTTAVTKTTSNHGNSGSKERTSGRHNGPIETAPVATATPGSSTKASASRSSDS